MKKVTCRQVLKKPRISRLFSLLETSMTIDYRFVTGHLAVYYENK